MYYYKTKKINRTSTIWRLNTYTLRSSSPDKSDSLATKPCTSWPPHLQTAAPESIAASQDGGWGTTGGTYMQIATITDHLWDLHMYKNFHSSIWQTRCDSVLITVLCTWHNVNTPYRRCCYGHCKLPTPHASSILWMSYSCRKGHWHKNWPILWTLQIPREDHSQSGRCVYI